MALLMSKTYETITEESAQNGETADSGFEWEDCPETVREAAEYLRNCAPSQSPIVDPANCWFTEYGEADYRTGEVENFAYHFGHANNPHALRYWKAAIRAAGFKIHGE